MGLGDSIEHCSQRTRGKLGKAERAESVCVAAPPTGIELETLGLASADDELVRVSSELQAMGIVQDGAAERVQRLQE